MALPKLKRKKHRVDRDPISTLPDEDWEWPCNIALCFWYIYIITQTVQSGTVTMHFRDGTLASVFPVWMPSVSISLFSHNPRRGISISLLITVSVVD
jgi:hypothetical protein